MKLKAGDKVYFTKESAPNNCETYLTYGKEYEVLSVEGTSFIFNTDRHVVTHSGIISSAHLNGGNWLKVKNKKHKLEKEIENLRRKIDTTEQLLKVSSERIEEMEKRCENIYKHTFDLTINN